MHNRKDNFIGKQFGKSNKKRSDVQEEYSHMGDEILQSMIKKAEKKDAKKQKKDEIIAKTNGTLGEDIYNVGTELMSKIKERKDTIRINPEDER